MRELLRRPKVKSSFASTWQASDALSFTATLVYVGPWNGQQPRLHESRASHGRWLRDD